MQRAINSAVIGVCLLAPTFAVAQVPADLAPPQIPYLRDTEFSVEIQRASHSSPIDEITQLPLPPSENGAYDPECGPCAPPKCEFLPLAPLLWQPPLAGLRQPRMYVIPNNVENYSTRQTIDTAIGATVGLFRFRPSWTPGTEFEIDFFGVHFSRWSERHLAVAGDYRYGFPVTFQSGPWQGKIGYEHTSTHLGDDFIKASGQFKVQYVRDEVVFGLAYRWANEIRLYGEFGYAVYLGSPFREGPERFAWGIEWSRQQPTGWSGQPFAAFDMDLRPEQGYKANLSAQLGWQWIPVNQRASGRIALQYYDGYSPYGQFLLNREHWFGVGLFIDF
jgi:hypothetical protein